jgi:hypothetical protein
VNLLSFQSKLKKNKAKRIAKAKAIFDPAVEIGKKKNSNTTGRDLIKEMLNIFSYKNLHAEDHEFPDESFLFKVID